MCSLSKIVFLDAVLKVKFWIPVGQNVCGIYQKGLFINYVKLVIGMTRDMAHYLDVNLNDQKTSHFY